MKAPQENTLELQKEMVQRVQQKFGMGGKAAIEDNRPTTVVQRKLISAMSDSEKSIQRKSAKGTSKFKEIAASMGEQYGVDTSSLKATHNSSFPTKLNAEATIQGKNIHFAPGMDTEYNIKHEVSHAIDNTINGTPKGDMVVNGQKVDTTRERVVDKMVNSSITSTNKIVKSSTNLTYGNNTVQRIGKLSTDEEGMIQSAGTCGMYALANAIAVAYGRNNDNGYRTKVKNSLLKKAAKLDVHVTAQGELLNFEDIQTLIDAYNENNQEPVELQQRTAPDSEDIQEWMNVIGEPATEEQDVSEEQLNNEQVGAIIAVDSGILKQYDENKNIYSSTNPIPFVENSSDAHWVTIVEINTASNSVTIHNSAGGDFEREYPLWVILQATTALEEVSKSDYLTTLFQDISGYGYEANEDGFARSQTVRLSKNKKKLINKSSKDYSTMFKRDFGHRMRRKVTPSFIGLSNVKRQRQIVVNRLKETQINGQHDVRLKNLIIRVKRADRQG
ncbi:hypothetical protein [uncultured Aquimarina sp.]|uniref:hypothetical protein n=1 Tax=uncultured Aquimarina sp. TaxID=575652 RepID=UPI0026179997|nr:hypothetical protein [uncultured Aquimarina sp.]